VIFEKHVFARLPKSAYNSISPQIAGEEFRPELLSGIFFKKTNPYISEVLNYIHIRGERQLCYGKK
jgi:hypothetical protein